jgi:hypothetical protein
MWIVPASEAGERVNFLLSALPDGVRLSLELLDERRFSNGVVHLHYRTNQKPESG